MQLKIYALIQIIIKICSGISQKELTSNYLPRNRTLRNWKSDFNIYMSCISKLRSYFSSSGCKVAFFDLAGRYHSPAINTEIWTESDSLGLLRTTVFFNETICFSTLLRLVTTCAEVVLILDKGPGVHRSVKSTNNLRTNKTLSHSGESYLSLQIYIT